MCSSPSGQALSMISSARARQSGETWAVASRDHSKSAQVASPVSSMKAVAGLPYQPGPT